ncbi:MAG: hypothetical protein DRJ42_02075 [Deltaproteobacteria bacterium]|nr:MAG: hypothetical protein DRJ42_02075 [Deltaproteobacteria bacterium]
MGAAEGDGSHSVTMTLRVARVVLALGLALLFACERSGSASEQGGAGADESGLAGAPIEPPFAVEGDLDGLLLVWFDEAGPHRASSRDEVPEAHREYVRVDSLRAAPDERLDAELVYVADIRTATEAGPYVVRTVRRDAYDALVDEAQGVAPLGALNPPEPTEETGEETGEPAPGAAAHAASEVIIYGADWCQACRASARFFTSRGVPFIEKNVEQDPAARAEMTRKAQAAGVRPSGIPVIDFRGTILTGFDQRRLEALIAAGG